MFLDLTVTCAVQVIRQYLQDGCWLMEWVVLRFLLRTHALERKNESGGECLCRSVTVIRVSFSLFAIILNVVNTLEWVYYRVQRV